MENSTKHWVFRGWKKLQQDQQISLSECKALIGFFTRLNRVLQQLGNPKEWKESEQAIARRVLQSFFYLLYRSQAERIPEQPLLHFQEIPRVVELAEQLREFQMRLSFWQGDQAVDQMIESITRAVEVLIAAAIKSFTLQDRAMEALTTHLPTAGLYELARLYLGENVKGEAICRWMNQKKRAWLKAMEKKELVWLAKQSLRDQLDVELSNWLYHRLFYSSKGEHKEPLSGAHIENYKKITTYYRSLIDFFTKLNREFQHRGYSIQAVEQQWILLIKKPLYYLFWHQARRHLYPALRERIDRRRTTPDDQFLLSVIKMVYDGKLTATERQLVIAKMRQALVNENKKLICIEGQLALALIELLRESQTMWVSVELQDVSLIREQKRLYKELLILKNTYEHHISSNYLPFSWITIIEETLRHLDDRKQRKFQEIAKPLTHKVVNIKKDGKN